VRKPKPHEVIRKYLDSHGGSVEVQVDALLASWKLDELTDEGRRAIERDLTEGGLGIRPPLAGLGPEDAVTVYTVEASAPADRSSSTTDSARRGGLLSRFGLRPTGDAEEPPTGQSEDTADPDGEGVTPAPAVSAPDQAGSPAPPPEDRPSTGSSPSAAELESLRSERESLRSERDTLRAELERTQREAAEAREEAERRSGEVSRLESAVETERQKISQAEGRTSLAGKAEEEAKSQAASLRSELEGARAETASARSEAEAARAELEAAQKRNQELEAAIVRERRPQEELEQARTELANAQSKAGQLLAGARALVESTTEELVTRTRSIAELEIRAGDAELSVQAAARELQTHRAHVDKLERQLATRREQEQEAEARMRGEQERGAQARAAFDAARAEQERLGSELATLQASVAEAQRGLAEDIFDSKVAPDRSAGEGRLEELAAAEERVGRELVRIGPEVSRRHAELEEAEHQGREAEVKLAEARSGMPELAGEHAQARGRLQALEEAEQSVHSDLEGLRKELREGRDGLDGVRIDAERRAAELVEAERALVEVAPPAAGSAEAVPGSPAKPVAPSPEPAPDKPGGAPAKRRRFGRRRG